MMFMNFSRAVSQIRLNRESPVGWVRHITKDYQPFSNGIASPEMSNNNKGFAAVQQETPSEFPDSALRMVKMIPGKGLPPEPPTCCCGTGCPSCVWIQYVEELTDYYKDGGEEAKQAIEQIPDESVKALVKMALITNL